MKAFLSQKPPHCPCCQFTLDPRVIDSDGCTPCPECGAAWNLTLWATDAPDRTGPALSGLQAIRSRDQFLCIPDGRGAIVPILGALEPPARIDRLREAGLVGNPDSNFGLACAVGLSLSLLGLFVHVLLALGTFALAFAIINARFRDGRLVRASRRFANTHVSHGLCPCCESQLRPTPSPIDNCLLCDTCGCAWKPDSPTTPAPNSNYFPHPSDLT